MEVWLFYVIFGLILDIIGICILARPLFRVVFKNESVWIKQYEKIKREYKIAVKEHEEQRYSIPKNTRDNLPFKRFEMFVFDVFNNTTLEKTEQRNLAFIGLTIITIGFAFQILGNIVQEMYY